LNKLHSLTGKDLQNKIEELLRSTKRPGIERVIKFLADRDFYTAPASTRFHGNHEGGLAEHSYNVFLLLDKKNIDYGLGIPHNSVIIAGLLHDICKVDFYTTGTRNVKDKAGKWQQVRVYQVEDKLVMGHGAKSVYMLQNMIRLTLQEAMMIRWHMGPFANEGDNQYGFNNACEQVPAVCAIHTADMEASNLFEETKKV
jgi:hypothetical protein